MKSNFLEELNPVQRAAVEYLNGPLLIVAGAGSGKTRVITYKIAHIINSGFDSFRILSLTFTNKAAKEMRERITHIVGPEAKNIWMGTFHAVFSRILRTEAELINYPKNFSIYDTDDSKSLLRAILKSYNLDDKTYKPNNIYSRISSSKNQLISAADYAADFDLMEQDKAASRPHFSKVYTEYQARLFKAGAMDFDDLLFNTFKLFNLHPEVLVKYQNRFQFIMVDEYQDTNTAQYKIIKMLSAAHRNLCVVGDDYQSIYGFRGANIQNILDFERDYPERQVFKLEQNYRSSSNIVDAASAMIRLNKKQFDKKLFTTNDAGERIVITRNLTDSEEGKNVASAIFEEKMKFHYFNKDFAILYRTNAQSRSLEEALRKLNIPYRIYGGQSFYQRKEIKDFLAYLKVIVNPKDEESLKRIINYPARGIGDRSIDKLIVLANEKNKSIWEITAEIEMHQFGSGANRIYDFGIMIKSFMAQEKQMTAFDIAHIILKESGVRADLFNDKTLEGTGRLQNVEELMNAISEFTANPENEDISLGSFLQSVSLLTDADKDNGEDNDKVSLMTVHASKGLEFKVIHIVGMEENLFPSMLALNSRADLEEERRLFYVAMTRAKEKLKISFALSRFKYGSIQHSEASRFLSELDPSYLKMEGSIPQGPKAKPEPRTYEKKADAATPAANLFQQPAAPPKLPEVDLSNFEPSDNNLMQEGLSVLHNRFGKGKIEKLEGLSPDIKATINFEIVGQKQILLRFAKLMIIN